MACGGHDSLIFASKALIYLWSQASSTPAPEPQRLLLPSKAGSQCHSACKAKELSFDGDTAVGREWRWQMDDPDMIVKGAIEMHQKMIKEYRGVPGVKAERIAEGMQVLTISLDDDTWHGNLQ